MGVEVLMVGALGWPTPTEDMGFWRPVLGELSLAGERDGAVSPNHSNTIMLNILLAVCNVDCLAYSTAAPARNVNVDTVCQAGYTLRETVLVKT